jgi:flagellar hook assembly protein FlgD
LGEVIAYTYSFPANGRIKLRVFDLAGRLITTLYDEYRGISFYKEDTWDGRDNLNRQVSPGTYILHLDVTDAVTGQQYQAMAPAVIGVYGN